MAKSNVGGVKVGKLGWGMCEMCMQGWAGKRWKGMEQVEEWNRIEMCSVMIDTGKWFEYCNKDTYW